MATIAENGLFPPIIDSYMPAITKSQLVSEGIRVKLNLNYNTLGGNAGVRSVHLSLIRQSNYHSVFLNDPYARGVYITDSISINPEDPNGIIVFIPYSAFFRQGEGTGENSQSELSQELSFNEYYKLQARFSTDTDPGYHRKGDINLLSDYLVDKNNLAKFSEWSTVCLVRFIDNPNFQIKVNGQDSSGLQVLNIDSSNVSIAGKYVHHKQTHSLLFHGQTDKEFLNRYKVIVKNSENEVVYSSDYLNIDLNNVNEINYTIPYYFDIGNYTLQLWYETANLYTNIETFPQLNVNYSSNAWGTQSVVQEMTGVNNILGKVNISFIPFDENTTVPAGSQFVIRRGSDEDNFAIWDEVYNHTLTEALTGTNMISFDDYTVESGVLYKYEITYVDNSGVSPTRYTIVEGPAMTIFDHAFLTGEGTQLCVKFNPSISGYQTNVADSMVTTLGSQFPYTQRGSDMYYRTFSLSGTIAYEMDEQHMFASRSSIYGDWIQVYGSYFVNHYMNQQNDRVTQRKFREIVERYLYNDTPKLFRSTPEGNILVKLTNISFTPKNEIGRLVYDFSCTATEIGEPSIANCKMYQIQDFGD